jgi:autoinducer 2 (AI-2) kinase
MKAAPRRNLQQVGDVTATYLMALDAGGGGGHCLLVDSATGRMTRTFRGWVHPPAPNTAGFGSDLDLPTMWERLGAAAREAMTRADVNPDQVVGVAVTSMRHAMVVLDATGVPIYASSNRDSRAIAEVLQLADSQGENVYRRTGHWPNPLAAAVQLRWMAANTPDAWERASHVLSLSDWLGFRLTGELAAEASQASEMLLLDVEKRDWAWALVDALGIPRRLLCTLRASGAVLGETTADVAAALGVRAGTPVAIAGADTQCGLLGAGATAAGHVAAIVGTTTPLQLVLDRPLMDARQRLWTGCHVLSERWVLESNGGMMGEALQWFAGILYPDSPVKTAHLLAEAGLSEPGAAGMFSTLGADVMNGRELRMPLGRVTMTHIASAQDPQRRRHLARAIVEGMAYAIRANLEQLEEVARTKPTALGLAGGVSSSAVFAQVVSDVVGLPVEVGATGEASALGAAICAGVGAGVFADAREGVRRLRGSPQIVQPDAGRVARYAELYAAWQQQRMSQVEADDRARQAMLPSVLKTLADTSTSSAPLFEPRLLITADMDDDTLAVLRQLGSVEYASFRTVMRLLTGDDLVAALAGVHVFVTEIDIVDSAALQRLPDLRVLAACRGNAVNVDLDACTAFGIPVLYAPGRNADAVADLTIAFVLALARKLPSATTFLRQPGTEPGDLGRMGQAFGTLQGRELWGKTIGLVGLGAVGRGVAQRLRGFGARIVVYDPYVRADTAALADAELVSLDELLQHSDFVSLHAPVADETRAMIGAEQLARMRPGACLINTARAALIDEDALVEALRSGHLGGAALDVFHVEPPGSDHPLLALDTVIATPHIGGNTVEVSTHQGTMIAQDLQRLLRRERPLHVLNPEALAGFGWTAPRRAPDAAHLAALRNRPAPAVSDIHREKPAAGHRAQGAGHRRQPEANLTVASRTVSPEVVERMERILREFTARVRDDATLRAFAAGKDVTLHFDLPDVQLGFFLRLRDGVVACDVGTPEPAADVELRLRAEVLDGMFMGSVNPMQAATSGRLSFSGDTVKAMTLQHVQADLSRLYRAARERVGDPGDLASLPDASGNGAAEARPQPVGPGDVREELVRIVNELYATQLITATGGNVSARIPGRDELWITPSQLFKGDLKPEILVRIDLDGNPLDTGTLAPSSERLMHCAVYKARADAQAVVHAHAPHATVLANSGLPFLPVSTEAAFFGEIPRIPFVMPGTEDLAQAIGAAVAKSWAVLMQNHGLLVAGRSLRRAADMVEIVERSSEVILGCHAVGKQPTVLPPDVVEMLQKMGDLLA